MRGFGLFLFFVGCGAALFCGASGFANPFDLVGLGSRNAAMAGAGGASTGGGSAAFLNPAALTLHGDAELEVSYGIMVPQFRAEVVNPGSLGNVAAFQQRSSGGLDMEATLASVRQAFSRAASLGRLDGFMAAGTFPFRRVISALDRELTLGALVFMPGTGSEVVKVEGVTPNDPVFVWLGSRLHRMMAVLSAGLEVWPGKVAIGGGAIILADIGGSVESVAPIAVFNKDDPSNPPPPKPSVATFRQDLSTDVAPVVGILVRPTDFLAFSVVYRHEMELSLDFRVKAGVYFDLGGVPIQADIPYRLQSDFFYLPTEITFCSAVRPWSFLSFNADVTVAFTSSFGSHLPVTRFTLDPSAVGPQGELVALESLGAFRAVSEEPLMVKTRDIVVAKVGTEVMPVPWLRIMAGYAYHPSPLEPDQGYGNMLLDGGFHRIGAGVSADVGDPFGALRRPLLLAGHFSAMILNKRYNKVGRVRGGKVDGAGVVKTEGYGLGGGLTVGFRF